MRGQLTLPSDPLTASQWWHDLVDARSREQQLLLLPVLLDCYLTGSGYTNKHSRSGHLVRQHVLAWGCGAAGK
jgi:hypothetical protein